eukprot:7903729-Alexandrium_andersonii.AAC.1
MSSRWPPGLSWSSRRAAATWCVENERCVPGRFDVYFYPEPPTRGQWWDHWGVVEDLAGSILELSQFRYGRRGPVVSDGSCWGGLLAGHLSSGAPVSAGRAVFLLLRRWSVGVISPFMSGSRCMRVQC